MTVLAPLQEVKLVYLFVKIEKFSFSVDKILRECHMTILKLQKDSPKSGEHSRHLQSIFGVSRKHFETHFKNRIFSKKLFFKRN